MSNELLLIVTALIDILFIFIAARIGGSKRLFGMIALNLILITIFGAKLITVFGCTTNVGNVFYACVFLATHFLLERHGRKEIYQTIWFGVASILFFLVLSQLALHFTSSNPLALFDSSLQNVFMISPRIALGSLLGYAFAQLVNIYIYDWLKGKTKNKYLWLRSSGANIPAQFVDSCLFFTIALIDLPGGALMQAIIAGWLIKSVVVMLGTPFLYLDHYLLNKKNSNA